MTLIIFALGFAFGIVFWVVVSIGMTASEQAHAHRIRAQLKYERRRS